MTKQKHQSHNPQPKLPKFTLEQKSEILEKHLTMGGKSTAFECACVLAGCEPTKRQLSKFNNHKGAAYNAWENRRRV